MSAEIAATFEMMIDLVKDGLKNVIGRL